MKSCVRVQMNLYHGRGSLRRPPKQDQYLEYKKWKIFHENRKIQRFFRYRHDYLARYLVINLCDHMIGIRLNTDFSQYSFRRRNTTFTADACNVYKVYIMHTPVKTECMKLQRELDRYIMYFFRCLTARSF